MLTDLVHQIEATEGILGDWSLPGAHTESAAYEMARTVCRRAERNSVRLACSGVELQARNTLLSESALRCDLALRQTDRSQRRRGCTLAQRRYGRAEVVKGMEMTKATGFDECERRAVYRAIRERRDVRRGFLPEPMPDELLQQAFGGRAQCTLCRTDAAVAFYRRARSCRASDDTQDLSRCQPTGASRLRRRTADRATRE